MRCTSRTCRVFRGNASWAPPVSVRRGDVIAELDWCVGQLLDTLAQLGLDENTIVIFSSDNGPVLDDGYADRAIELCGDHRPAGPLRGGKYSMFDGGTRVPFLLRWTGTVAPCESAAIVSHVDFLGVICIAGRSSPRPGRGSGLDLTCCPRCWDRSDTGRRELVTEGLQARTVLRQGDWVFIPPHDGPRIIEWTGTETGNLPEAQLYDLSLDIGQIKNVVAEHPERVKEMSHRLREIREGEKTRL